MPTTHDAMDDLNDYLPPTPSEAATMFDDEDYDAAYFKSQAAVDALANDDDQHDPTTAPSADDDDEDAYERIGEYGIHPAATFFPLLTGERFEELVTSIRECGQTAPIIQSKDGSIMDGRNRLRAIMQLQSEGHEIEPWIETWESEGGQTEDGYIVAANLHRRHLSDDQRSMIVTDLLPFIETGLRERQKATRIKKGEARNRTGRNQHSPKMRSETEPSPPSTATKKNVEKEAKSTRGKVAAAAKVSSHKASAAIAVKKSGDSKLINEVKTGKKSLAKAQKEIKPEKKTKTTEPEYDLAREVTSKWTRWLEKFDVADRPEVRAIVARLIEYADKKRPKA